MSKRKTRRNNSLLYHYVRGESYKKLMKRYKISKGRISQIIQLYYLTEEYHELHDPVRTY